MLWDDIALFKNNNEIAFLKTSKDQRMKHHI